MDNSIIPAVIQTMVIIFQIILTIINIATVFRWIILPFIFMGPILFYLTRYFCRTIQNIQELENNSMNYQLKFFPKEFDRIESHNDFVLP